MMAEGEQKGTFMDDSEASEEGTTTTVKGGAVPVTASENICGCADEYKRHSRQASSASAKNETLLCIHDMLSVLSSEVSEMETTGIRQRHTGADPEHEELYDAEEYENDVDPASLVFPKLGEVKGQIGQQFERIRWTLQHHSSLPAWLQDNDFLHFGHRPQLGSAKACFASIFRLHTETLNIWTHMLGGLFFLICMIYYILHPEIQSQEKLVFSTFFFGAVACLVLSSLFHTLACHSHRVGLILAKLDYCGISLLIIGSFIPWLFYGFYCRFAPKLVYMSMIVSLGTAAVIVSLWDRFGEPEYRPLRAGLFVALGLSGVIPCVHYFITDGFWSAMYEASLGWLLLMAALYLVGATIYAFRIPERFFPGKFDIWISSHQIWHLFVVAAACVHYKGIRDMAIYRLNSGSCEAPFDDLLRKDGF